MTAEVRTQCAALIETFGDGWSGGDAKKIASVFAENGVFVPDPFGSPVEGAEAIEAYWGDIPYEQSEIKFRFGEIYTVGPWFATEFKCTFRRRRTGQPVDVRGALFCETSDGKVSEMRMYYHRVVSGI